jgi:hypothetical protein
VLIQHFTEKVAAVVAARYVGDPAGELLVWLQTALRRESSVGELYGQASLDMRLAELRAPRELVHAVGAMIGNVWAQERGHAAYLDGMLVAVARTPSLLSWAAARVEGLMGAIEGWVMHGKTAPSRAARLKAQLLLAIGQRVQHVPEFVSSLSTMSFREYCLLNADLESTAIMGYERMLALLARLPEDGIGSTTTLAADLGKLAADERFHHDLFRALGAWFDTADGDSVRPEVTLRGCREELAAIRARAYR